MRLPDPEKALQLYVHEKEGIALGVLSQRLGPEPQSVAYLPKRIDRGAGAFKKRLAFCVLRKQSSATEVLVARSLEIAQAAFI